MQRSSRLALLATVALVAGACQAGVPATQAPVTSEPTGAASPADERADWPDKLVLGLVPSREADVLVENARPLTDHLSQELDLEVEGFVPQDYTGLVEAIGTGQADIGAFGPFSLVQAADRHGAEIVLQSVRFGSATYHTQWMTADPETFCQDEPTADDDGNLGCNGTTEASEGPVGEESLPSVEGQTVSYVEQSSASGYVFPALQLLNLGIDPQEDVEPIFAGGHDASVLAVYNGDAVVGVSFDDARGTIAEEFPDVAQKVVTFAYSQEIPNDGWVVRKELPESLKEAIVEALLAYAKSDEGKETLNAIYEIDDLVVADQAAFDVVRDAADKLGVTED